MRLEYEKDDHQEHLYIFMNCNRSLFCFMVYSYAAIDHRKVKKKETKNKEKDMGLFKINNIMCFHWLS